MQQTKTIRTKVTKQANYKSNPTKQCKAKQTKQANKPKQTKTITTTKINPPN
jgi:hypothetical protein